MFDSRMQHKCRHLVAQGQVWSTSDMKEFFDSIPNTIQAGLSTYLSTGDCDCLNICGETFHFYFHYACKWNDASLFHACVLCCVTNGMSLPEAPVCDCRKILDFELDKLNANVCHCSQTYQSLTTKTRTPEYLILFTSPILGESHRRMAVFDKRTSNIFSVLASKEKYMGEGYAVCSFHAEKVPYVVISGGKGKSSAAKLYSYDVVRDKWKKKVNLTRNRSGHVMCYCFGQIYLIGGLQTSSVEVCEIESKKRVDIGSLPVAVHNMAHVIADGKIYLFGGENNRGKVSAVQCIDTKTKTITRLRDLPCECSGGQAVLFNQTIFIATHQGHMIKYDIVTGNSELCNHQPFCRKYFAMFTKDDCIFIIGGIRTDGHSGVPCILCKYVPQTDQWVKAATFAKPVPIYASCAVQYPKTCPIIPFSSSL